MEPADQLTQIVHEVINEGRYIEPKDLAREVSMRTPGDILRECYTITLISYIIKVQAQRRSGNEIVSGSLWTEPEVTQEPESAQPEQQGERISGLGPRAERRSEWYEKWLNDVYAVHGQRKRLRDFTPSDCEFAAKHHEQLSRVNEAKAEQFYALARRMREAGVSTVEELMRQSSHGN